ARWRAAAVVVVVALVLAGAGWAGWTWSQRQLFVGPSDGHVAVFRGVTQDLGPLHLSHVVQVSDIPLTDLPVHYRDLVVGLIVLADEAQVSERMAVLESAASSCRLQAATGTPCGELPVAGATARPTSTPSTTPASTP
ncbi:MAG: serine/threonine-protein phosphatase, partial [Actinomycetota bacterium]|nr:serine/threonine-protein phosphatase [Actinomycetota bacterium]